VSNPGRPNFKGFSHELVFRIHLDILIEIRCLVPCRLSHLSVIIPVRGLGPASRHGWVVANLLGYISVLFIEPAIFKRLALKEVHRWV
jgi:hypothetical protein